MNEVPEEGYVYFSYGPAVYLKHVLASVNTLRRYDRVRPVVLFADRSHIEILAENGLVPIFFACRELPQEHQSITGVKHHLERFLAFGSNLFLDSDIIWCRNPDALWQQLRPFTFTITGHERSDFFFGGPKGAGVILEYLLDRRRRTMERFNLTHLPRVQSGMIFVSHKEFAQTVCEKARNFLGRRHETHFRSRLTEAGRTLESCEWSLAMAMSSLNLHVYPWFQGYNSPQLDFIAGLTAYDPDFQSVSCRYYCDRLTHSLRGLPGERLRSLLTAMVSKLPGRGDYMEVTPYMLHFGWRHQKAPFQAFAERVWQQTVDYAGQEV